MDDSHDEEVQMEVIVKGSVQSLLVALRDRLGNLTSLDDATSVTFDVQPKGGGTAIESNVPVTFDADDPMVAICEVDTTDSGYTAGEEYWMYLKYTTGSESPILGPVKFRVEV